MAANNFDNEDTIEALVLKWEERYEKRRDENERLGKDRPLTELEAAEFEGHLKKRRNYLLFKGMETDRREYGGRLSHPCRDEPEEYQSYEEREKNRELRELYDRFQLIDELIAFIEKYKDRPLFVEEYFDEIGASDRDSEVFAVIEDVAIHFGDREDTRNCVEQIVEFVEFEHPPFNKYWLEFEALGSSKADGISREIAIKRKRRRDVPLELIVLFFYYLFEATKSTGSREDKAKVISLLTNFSESTIKARLSSPLAKEDEDSFKDNFKKAITMFKLMGFSDARELMQREKRIDNTR